MKFIKIVNLDDRVEYVRADQIIAITTPIERTKNGGALLMANGRKIGLSDKSLGQTERILRELQDTK